MTLERRTPLRARTGLKAKTAFKSKTALRSKSSLKAGGRLRQVSEKRAGQLVLYRLACLDVDRRDRGMCAAAKHSGRIGPCGGRPGRQPIEHDHMDGRQGLRLVNVADIQSLCAAHHDWVTDHTPEARALGLRR